MDFKVAILMCLCGMALCAPKPQEMYEDKAKPYDFGYKITDPKGNDQYHHETGDEYGNKKGAYGYRDAYGQYRDVKYVADEYGFKAYIKSNEQGLGGQNPADVQIEKSGSAPKTVHKVAEAPKPHVRQIPSYGSKTIVERPHSRPLIHANPSYTLAVAQAPDRDFRRIHAPRPQRIHKVAPAALGKDVLTVAFNEHKDYLKIRPAVVPKHPQLAEQPIHKGPAPTRYPGKELKTFTEKPSQKPEYRPKFASKVNY